MVDNVINWYLGSGFGVEYTTVIASLGRFLGQPFWSRSSFGKDLGNEILRSIGSIPTADRSL
jgi:hypothetical protein